MTNATMFIDGENFLVKNYFGFQPNKGLMYTTDATVLFRDDEIIKACGIGK